MPNRAKILLRNRNSLSEYPILGWGGPAVGCWIKNDIPSNVYTLLGFQIAFRIFPSRPPLCWDAKKDENLTPKPKFGFGVTHFWVYLRSGWSIWKMTLGAWLWVGWNQYMSNWRRSENWRSDTLNIMKSSNLWILFMIILLTTNLVFSKAKKGVKGTLPPIPPPQKYAVIWIKVSDL